jgi:ribosomal protein S18 acetylase RimI-like enzyme
MLDPKDLDYAEQYGEGWNEELAYEVTYREGMAELTMGYEQLLPEYEKKLREVMVNHKVSAERLTKWDKAHKAIAEDDELWNAVADYVACPGGAFDDTPGLAERFCKIIATIPPFRRELYRGEPRMGDGRLPADLTHRPEFIQKRGFRSFTSNLSTAEEFARDSRHGIVIKTVGKIQAVSLESICTWRMRVRQDESHYCGMQAEWFVLDNCKTATFHKNAAQTLDTLRERYLSASGKNQPEAFSESGKATVTRPQQSGAVTRALRAVRNEFRKEYPQSTDDDFIVFLREGKHPQSSISLLQQLKQLRPAFADVAQHEYDKWFQDENGVDEQYGEGGICSSISREMMEVISSNLEDVKVAEGGQDGDDHSWVIAWNKHEAYGVDIPAGVYETGGGYKWVKRKNVTITVDDVNVFKVDVSPEELDKQEGFDEGHEASKTAALINDPKWMLRNGRFYQEQFENYDQPHPAYIPASSLNWKAEREFDLNNIAGWPHDFRWARDEVAAEYEDDYREEMVKAIKSGDIEPLVVVEGTDGNFYLWDGNHRAAMAYDLHIYQLPAYVGYQKASKKAAAQKWYHGTSKKNAERIIADGYLRPGMDSLYTYEDIPREDAVYITCQQAIAEAYAMERDNGIVLEVVVPDPQNLLPDEDSIHEALRLGKVICAEYEDQRLGQRIRDLWLKKWNDEVNQYNAHGDNLPLMGSFEEAWKTWGEIEAESMAEIGEQMKEMAEYIRDNDPELSRQIIAATCKAAHIGKLKVVGKAKFAALHRYSPEQILNETEAHQNTCYAIDDPIAGGCAKDFNWTQVDAFPVDKLEGTAESWKLWFEQEKNWAADGGRPENYFEEMEKWWTNNPDEHMIVVEGTDGKHYVWEGTHRLAIAKIHNMKTVPVFLGIRKIKTASACDLDEKTAAKNDWNATGDCKCGCPVSVHKQPPDFGCENEPGCGCKGLDEVHNASKQGSANLKDVIFMSEFDSKPKSRGYRHVVVKDKKGKRVGSITIDILGDTGYVQDVNVNRPWQGRGIGQRLYDMAIEGCRKYGLSEFRSDYPLDRSDDANAIWHRLMNRYEVEFEEIAEEDLALDEEAVDPAEMGYYFINLKPKTKKSNIFSIHVPDDAKGAFDKPQDRMAFWAFKEPPRCLHGEKIVFTSNGSPFAEAVVHHVEEPGASKCSDTGNFEASYKVFWDNSSFKKFAALQLTEKQQEALERVKQRPAVQGGVKTVLQIVSELPREIHNFWKDIPAVKKAIVEAPTVEVDPYDLKTQQNDISPRTMKFLIEHPGVINSPVSTKWDGISYEHPVVYTINGELFISDGNHRASAALLLDMMLKVKMVEVPDSYSGYWNPAPYKI